MLIYGRYTHITKIRTRDIPRGLPLGYPFGAYNEPTMQPCCRNATLHFYCSFISFHRMKAPHTCRPSMPRSWYRRISDAAETNGNEPRQRVREIMAAACIGLIENGGYNSSLTGLAVIVMCDDFIVIKAVVVNRSLQRPTNTGGYCTIDLFESEYVIPRSKHSTIGDCAFPVAAARVWNNFPPLVSSSYPAA